MKILWVTTNFMHPVTKGGIIRTLGILGYLHRRHEVHFVAIEDPAHLEGPARAGEYSSRAYSLHLRVPDKRSPAFALQLATGLVAPLPLAVSRFRSPNFASFLETLLREQSFDRAVVDFLPPASYYPDLSRAVLFQHNVETMIWRRHAEHASDPLRRAYFRLQARKMFQFERRVCRTAGHVIAVSEVDAAAMREMFGAERVSHIPTGVDIAHFSNPGGAPATADLVFVGSMDWLPNVDGVLYFVREILPLIRRARPDCTFAIVGRTPPPEISDLAARDPRITVTGTVPDVRPYLWGSSVSVVPLRIGGGTRLKIYEAMAAGAAVVSTPIGAEGLEVHPPADIRVASHPEEFAAECLALLADPAARHRQAAAARDMVRSRFSWDQVGREFETILESAPAARRDSALAACQYGRAERSRAASPASKPTENRKAG